MNNTIESRLDRLEESLAHNEIMSNELSDQLAEQWRLIERQNRLIAELKEKIDNLEADSPVPANGHQPPPHY